MLISHRRVHNIERHLAGIAEGTRLRLAVPASSLSDATLTRAGFTLPLHSGDSLLPSSVGPITRFNADGKFVVHRDRPKEPRYITTIEWSWEEWTGHGQTVTRTDYKDIYRDCYPRTFVPPPAEELTVLDQNGQLMLVTREFVWRQGNGNTIQHAINVCLELFGLCDVRTQDLGSLSPPVIRRVNWRLLPPGAYPWSAVNEHVRESLRHRSQRYSGPILYRHQVLSTLEPDEVYVGQAGFRDYVAFVFHSKGWAVLESRLMDNATYIFGENWARLSQMTKAEIIDGGHYLHRLVHSAGWEDRLRNLFR